MLNHILVIVIFYLIINQMILAFSDEKVNILQDTNSDNIVYIDKKEPSNYIDKNNNYNIGKQIPFNLFGKPYKIVPNKFIMWTFIIEKPWTQIVYNYGQKFPFKFFIKIKIQSLNDYQTWKDIIPNLDFDSKTGEIIIPSKDEAGALAIANLIISNFQGQLSIENILEKNLIPISITKAQQHDMIKNKLREQIIESLQSKTIESNNKTKTNFEKDLANENKSNIKQNFENINAYEGIEYTYL
jgi:hypothetical protein